MTASPCKRNRAIASDSPMHNNDYSAVKAQRIEDHGSRSPDKKRRKAEGQRRMDDIRNDSWGANDNFLVRKLSNGSSDFKKFKPEIMTTQ